MLLSVIIVSYNTSDFTLQTVESVLKTASQSSFFKNKLEVIIVDNNSKDDTISRLKKIKKDASFPIKIIANSKNLGFAKANNLAVKKSAGEYIIFLNSDTIVGENALENMVKRFQSDKKEDFGDIRKLGILSAALLNSNLTYQPQGGSFPTLTTLFIHMTLLDDLPIIGKLLPSTQHTGKSARIDLDLLEKTDKIIEVDWIAGTAMMAPRQTLEEIGYLDPNIFMYGEDMEICLRANNHHLQVGIEPKAQIIHLQNQSSSSENAIRGEFEGYLYIFSKHKSPTQTSLARIILQIGCVLRILLFGIFVKDRKKAKIYQNLLSSLSSRQ
jgi:GT2 family glycosyltransferase